MKHTPLVGFGFMMGLIVGCTTTAVIAQDDAPPPVETTVAAAGARVVSPEQATSRYAPNGKARAMLYATGEQAFVGTLEMEGGAAVPVHRDPTEEYIFVLEGSGTITIDGKAMPVTPKSLIYMPAGAEVSFQNGADKLVAVQVFADPGPEKKYDAWSATMPSSAASPGK